jgi:mono/diheme cytochrome c family protein
MLRGEQRFNINCAICHGMTAAGNGIVKQYGLATVVSLQDERIRNMADGEIFNTITNGKNTMLSYGPNVTVADRWAIIAYLRALQRSQNATAADVPPEARVELEKP